MQATVGSLDTHTRRGVVPERTTCLRHLLSPGYPPPVTHQHLREDNAGAQRGLPLRWRRVPYHEGDEEAYESAGRDAQRVGVHQLPVVIAAAGETAVVLQDDITVAVPHAKVTETASGLQNVHGKG